MEASLNLARENMLEWWYIFSMTGDIEDARGLIEASNFYNDLLLADEYEGELEQ